MKKKDELNEIIEDEYINQYLVDDSPRTFNVGSYLDQIATKNLKKFQDIVPHLLVPSDAGNFEYSDSTKTLNLEMLKQDWPKQLETKMQ